MEILLFLGIIFVPTIIILLVKDKLFPVMKVDLIKLKNQMNNQQLTLLSSEIEKQKKDVRIAYLLWFLFGFLGAHRFYLGQTVLGFLYLFSFGIFFIGLFIDLFALPSTSRKVNEEIELKIINSILASADQRGGKDEAK